MTTSPMTVLRIAKLKSWGSIGGTGAHNNRQRKTPNANLALTPSNHYYIGKVTDHLPTLVREKIGEQTIRKNAVLAFEVVMSASPHYFRSTAPNQGGQWDNDRLNDWAITSMDWLYEKWGKRIISAVMHLDEQTPHIQAVVVPLDDKGKLNCRALLGGSRQTLRDLQTAYAHSVQHLGIQRGIEGSKAKHQDIQSYYRHANSAFEPLPEVTTPPPAPLRPAPEVPGFFAGSATKAAYQADIKCWEREKQTHDEQAQQRNAEQQAQTDAALTAARRHQAQAAQAAQLAEEIATLKIENSRLLAERQALKAQADQLRGTELAEVLERMYSAHEAADSRPSYRTRKFEIEGRPGNIAVTGELWIDNSTGQGGKGAINLVLHLEGYGQSDYTKALRLMTEHFNAEQIGKDMGRAVALGAPTTLEAIRQQQPTPPLPTPQPTTWERAKAYLVNVRKIPVSLVDRVHELGLIYSDERANLVFKRDSSTGCFKRGSYDPKDRPPFKQTLGRNALPFVINGKDGALYVTEGPIDALALKALHPTSTVIATGGNCPLERLKPYLDRATERIYLAHDRDEAGEQQAKRLQTAYKASRGAPVERYVPTIAKDWSASLMASPGLSRWGIKPTLTPEPPKPSIIDQLRTESARRQFGAIEPTNIPITPNVPASPPQPTHPRSTAPVFRPPKGPGITS